MKKIIPHILLTILFTLYLLGFEFFMGRPIEWIEGGLFFLFILWITLFFRYYRVVYTLIIGITFLHGLFFSYFQRTVTHTDIKLFFTHMEESFNSFWALSSLFLLPFIFLLLGVILLWLIKYLHLKPLQWQSRQKYAILLLLLVVNFNAPTMGFELLHASISSSSGSANRQYREDEIPQYPLREVDYSIVLVVGESMRYDSYVEKKLRELGFFSKKIYSSATNTDVVLPLLLNAKTNPLYLSSKNESNLFRLAKKSGFKTHFISMQTPKEGQYIKPYLQLEKIDHYITYTEEQRTPKYDSLLLDRLEKIDLSSKQFVVMQQIGQHSPYTYFEGIKSKSPAENYRRSLQSSFKLYAKMYDVLLKKKKPFIFIYVSDHGEFLGEGGRYGHNCFEPKVYEVPMFITSNIKLPPLYKDIDSQYQLTQWIKYLLGYDKELLFSKEKFVINGTMLSREDGFIEINNTE